MMCSSQLYSLTWGEFGTSLVSAVQHLRCQGELVDVTLAAGGRSFPAHKIVLSAASPFLLDLLKSTPCRHPVLLLSGVNASDLEAILEFVYRGEVSVDPSQLPSLLQAAHCLNIQGLAPGALHPEGKIDEVLAAHHPMASRDSNQFSPSKRKKKLKRKIADGCSSGPVHKKRHHHHSSAADGDGLPSAVSDVLSGAEGSIMSDDMHTHSGDDTGAKVRGASDQPATCPLCGATLRQARNLRRHLEMLHFGAGKMPPPDTEPSSADGSPSGVSAGGRAASRSSNNSMAASPVNGSTGSADQSGAAIVMMPSTLCQPVMLASPEEAGHQQQQQQSQSQSHPHHHDHQPRIPSANLACMLGPPLLPPPSMASSMIAAHHHPQHFIRYPGHPVDFMSRTDQQILRGVGIYTDTRLPRPDPGGGGGIGTEL